MIDMNSVCLVCRLTEDPNLKYTPNGKAVCSMPVASNNDYGEKKEVSYFNIVAWGKVAEVCSEYLKKGKRIAVDGHLKQDRWQDKVTGNNRSKVVIVAGSVQFLDPKGEKTKVTYEEQTENPPEDSGKKIPA